MALNYRVGHVLLAGDAAHMMPPFAGQALNAGIRDVANLAWKIAAHVKGTGTDALVGTYQAERRPHAVDMVRLSHRIGMVVMNVNPRLTAIRDAAITASGIVPAAKGWLGGHEVPQTAALHRRLRRGPGSGSPEAGRRPHRPLPLAARCPAPHRRYRRAGHGARLRLGAAALPCRHRRREFEVQSLATAGTTAALP